MNKLKRFIFLETIALIILVLILINVFNIYFQRTQPVAYCNKYMSTKTECLLSPRVISGILSPQSYLIFNLQPLKQDIQDFIKINNLNVSVYVVNLRDSASFGINSNQLYPALSLNKLPVAMIMFKKIENKELTLETKLPIYDRDKDSFYGSLYSEDVTEMSVRELLRRMLSESDDTALNTLAEQINADDLQRISYYLDYFQLDSNDQEPPFNDTFQVSAKSAGNIFLSLYLSTVLNPGDSELMLSYLTNTSFDIKSYANVSDDVIVAQKFGSYYNSNLDMTFFHSCGIIYVNDSRFLYCVMTKDIKNQEKAQKAVGIIVNKIYDYIIEGRKLEDSGIGL
jgi:beta-lactamase class A